MNQDYHRSTFRKSPNRPSQTTTWKPHFTHLTATAKVGRCAENLVCHYLRMHGWTIRMRNFETHRGEIDIIAERMDADLKGYPTVAFVEVKSRTSRHGLSPEYSVTPAKRKKVTSTMKYWIGTHPFEKAVYRCDIASVIIEKHKSPRIQYFPSAFSPREQFGW
ncbi:MAG: YraN family protein [Proteobacteria bacterium]|nr:YraN family protein [Pseudomonadota bacterium]